jgi:hypothetical protein
MVDSAAEGGPEPSAELASPSGVARTECRGFDKDEDVEGRYALDGALAMEGGRGMLSRVLKNMAIASLSGALENEGYKGTCQSPDEVNAIQELNLLVEMSQRAAYSSCSCCDHRLLADCLDQDCFHSNWLLQELRQD